MTAYLLFVLQLYWTMKKAQIVNSIITNDLDFTNQGGFIQYSEIQLVLVGTTITQIVNFKSVTKIPMVSIWVKEFVMKEIFYTDNLIFLPQISAITLSTFQLSYQAPLSTLSLILTYIIIQDVPEQQLRATQINFASVSSQQNAFTDVTSTNYISWAYMSGFSGYYGFQFTYNNITRLASFLYGTDNILIKNSQLYITIFLLNQNLIESVQNSQTYCGMLGQLTLPNRTVGSYNNFKLNQPTTSFVGLSYFSVKGFLYTAQFRLQSPTATDYTLCDEGHTNKLVLFTTEVFALYKCPLNSGIVLQSCSCNTGFYNSSSTQCSTCSTQCLTCSQAGDQGCLSCNPTLQYYSGTCLLCHYSCKNCTGITNAGCSACDNSQNRSLLSTSCVCQPGYFDSGIALCQSCDQSCTTCSNARKDGCLSCNALNFRQINTTQQLTFCTCLPGYFDDGTKQCQPCDQSCGTCSNATEIGCLSCNASNFRVLNSTSCICQFLYADNGTSLCIFTIQCDPSCLTCYDEYKQGCLTCDGSSPQFRQKSINDECLCKIGYYASSNGGCDIINCAINQYFDTTYRKCGNCDYTCLTCSGPTQYQCLSCDSMSRRSFKDAKCQCGQDYFAQSNIVQCSKQCNGGYQIGAQCIQCHPICAECQGTSPLDCTECKLSQQKYDEINTNQNGQLYYQESPINLILSLRRYECKDSSSSELVVPQISTKYIVKISILNLNTNDTVQLEYNQLNMILPKKLKGGQQYLVSVQVSDDQNSIRALKTSFKISILSASKVVSLVGGNRVITNTESLLIQSQIFDFDNQDINKLNLTNYLYLWSCNSIMSNTECLNSEGQILDTSSIQSSLTIPANQLTPYNSYQFNVVVYDQSERNRYKVSAVYVVVEQSVPILTLDYDRNILAIPINQNLKQQFKFNYQQATNPDDLFYSANLVYNFDIVSTIVYHYLTVNFRIWDFFDNFTNSSGTKLYFIASVFNPKYLMPSTFKIVMNVNLPPDTISLQNNIKSFIIQFHFQITLILKSIAAHYKGGLQGSRVILQLRQKYFQELSYFTFLY